MYAARQLSALARSRLHRPGSGAPRYFSTGAATPPPSFCDAVIIGGGAIGCSTLYHLTRLGFTNVVLLEQARLTAGTTWHTAGLVWSLRPSDTDIQLLRATRELCGRLESETGQHSGWNQNGGLFLASTKERLDEYKRLHTLGKAFGIHSEVLSPKEAAERYPLLDPSTLYGTLLSEGDGNLDPSSYCWALTKYATARGARVIEGCGVASVQTAPTGYGKANHRRVTGVKTTTGDIITSPVVINCTGAWAARVTRPLGLPLPLVPMKHSYVVFDAIPALKGMPNLRDHDEGVYFRIQSDSLSIGGYEPNPIILPEGDPASDFAFGLYELDWDIFGRHVEGAARRMPILASTGVKSTICGPESFTPDHKPLLGPAPELEGFIHGCGFNSAGMMFSGGCGEQLARWVVGGVPELDMFAFDVRRFLPRLAANTVWSRERSHEAYAKNYSIVFKHDEPLAGRNQILSPLHSLLQEKGCVFQERQGWERAGHFGGGGLRADGKPRTVEVQPYDWYGSYDNAPNADQSYPKALQAEYHWAHGPTHEVVRAEVTACRSACAIFDMSYFGKFFLIGPDAAKAAQWLFTAQMERPPGSTVYTCFLNSRGGTEADLTATVIDSSARHRLPQDPSFEGTAYYLAIGGTTAAYTRATLESAIRAGKFDVELVDRSEDYAMISVQGPRSRALLQRLLPDTSLSNEEFPFSTHKVGLFGQAERGRVPVRLIRVSFVGELGWELHVPREHCTAVYEELHRSGAEFGLRDAGYRAIDSLSVEKGYRHWHADLRPDDSPIEAGLGFTCKLRTDVPFLGREALEKKKAQGLQKRLTCFTLEGDVKERRTPLWGLEGLWTEEAGAPDGGAGPICVGYLRTAEYSFTMDRSLGYGYIHKDALLGPLAEGNKDWWKGLEGRKWWVEVMGVRVPARAHLKSPFDPGNKRVKGEYD